MRTHSLNTCEFGFHNITAQVKQDVRESGVSEGLCTVFCPHTTAAITINENADPDVQRDLKLALGDIFGRYDRPDFHHAEGNSHAHLKSSVVGASETIPIYLAGHLLLRVRRSAQPPVPRPDRGRKLALGTGLEDGWRPATSKPSSYMTGRSPRTSCTAPPRRPLRRGP